MIKTLVGRVRVNVQMIIHSLKLMEPIPQRDQNFLIHINVICKCSFDLIITNDFCFVLNVVFDILLGPNSASQDIAPLRRQQLLPREQTEPLSYPLHIPPPARDDVVANGIHHVHKMTLFQA